MEPREKAWLLLPAFVALIRARWFRPGWTERDSMTHCDSGMALRDTPRGSERRFHLKGGCPGASDIPWHKGQKQRGGFTLPQPKRGFLFWVVFVLVRVHSIQHGGRKILLFTAVECT